MTMHFGQESVEGLGMEIVSNEDLLLALIVILVFFFLLTMSKIEKWYDDYIDRLSKKDPNPPNQNNPS